MDSFWVQVRSPALDVVSLNGSCLLDDFPVMWWDWSPSCSPFLRGLDILFGRFQFRVNLTALCSILIPSKRGC